MLGPLSRIKVIKDLLLNKLDGLENRIELATTRLEQINKRIEELHVFSRAQLENESSLLEASIYTIETLKKHQTQPKTAAPSADPASFSRLGRSLVLLGNATEINYVRTALASEDYELLAVEWDWDSDLDPARFADGTPILLCKLPMKREHWQSIDKLQDKLSDNLFVLSWLRPSQPPST